MKKLLLLVIGLLISTQAHAGLVGGAEMVLNGGGTSDSIACLGTQTIYTKAFQLYDSNVFGVWFQATSASSTASISTVELQQSYTLPTTEGSSDSNWVEADSFDDIFTSVSDEAAHITTLAPVPMPYGRYKITGATGNPYDTVIKIYNFKQTQN